MKTIITKYPRPPFGIRWDSITPTFRVEEDGVDWTLGFFACLSSLDLPGFPADAYALGLDEQCAPQITVSRPLAEVAAREESWEADLRAKLEAAEVLTREESWEADLRAKLKDFAFQEPKKPAVHFNVAQPGGFVRQVPFCGATSADGSGFSPGGYTFDGEKVTCKRCLKRFEKQAEKIVAAFIKEHPEAGVQRPKTRAQIEREAEAARIDAELAAARAAGAVGLIELYERCKWELEMRRPKREQKSGGAADTVPTLTGRPVFRHRD